MRASQPGKMPGFFVSRSRENSMTLAERLIQKGFDEGFKEGFKKGALEVRGKQPAGCGIWAGRRNGFRRRPDFPVKN